MRREDRDDDFSQYVVTRQAALRRVAYGLCGSWAQADDLLQTALTKLYVAWPRVRAAANEDAYVRRTLLNTHLDETRRPWRRERPGLPDHERPVAEASGLEDRDELVAALQRLPRMQRQVVVLRFIADLPVEATARELGISPGTVKSHTSRALARLHELLDPTLQRGETS